MQENLASHAVTFMRMQPAKNPQSGHVYAMNVKYRREASIRKAWAKIADMGKPLFSPNLRLLSRHAHIQSNGQVLRVDW